MSYELQKTHWARKERYKPPAIGFPSPPDPDMKPEMLRLYRTIETLLPQIESHVLQFIGTQEGEGTSTIVREFARIAATEIGKSVLLLDADSRRPSRHHFHGSELDYGWMEALETGRRIEQAIYQVGESSLYFSPSRESSASTPQTLDSLFVDLCSNLMRRFNLVIIDSPPLSVSSDGLAIASKVDGVVIVIEAERTRWRAVKNVLESIHKVEGNVLGVVFNKRRFYFPEFVYKLL
jgi:Mrp family chromosome partitioning ATPase